MTPIVRAPLMSKIQVRLARACCTVHNFLFLYGITAKSRGARSLMQCPWSHLSVQNKVFLPLPTSEIIAIEQSFWTWTGTYIDSADQGRCGSFFCNQSHLARNAQPRFLRLEMPKPPSSVGEQAVSHATRQCPHVLPCALSTDSFFEFCQSL